MCTKEEVQTIVDKSEERTNKRLDAYAVDNNRVISNLFGDVKNKLDSLEEKMDNSILDRNSIHAKLEELSRMQQLTLEQTTRTNGRVSKLENWRMFIVGGLTILASLFIPVLLMVVHEWIS